MRIIVLSLLCSFVLVACSPAPPPSPPAPTGHAMVYSKEAKFANVRDDLKNAIINRGLVIDHTSHIHDMLTRTGKDLGTTTGIYVDGEAFSFCSAVISRKTMEADAHNIVFCPYVVVAYTTLKEPEKVYVAFRRPQRVGDAASQASLTAVEELLDGIAREALNLPGKS